MRKTILQDQHSYSVEKTARKNTKYSRNKTFLKISHLANAIAHAKAIAFAKWSVWVKNWKCQKHAKTQSTRTVQLFCAEKDARKKHQIFEKWDNFENQPSCKGYSLCKMISSGQQLKMPKTCENQFYNNSTVVLCKKRLEKTPNIREMRQIWKSAILQRL